VNDLVVLVADKNMSTAIAAILTNHDRLRIRSVDFRGPYLHPKRDPGVYNLAHDFLRPFQQQASNALVVFDRDGCGSPQTRDQLEADVEARLSQNGWSGRSAAIAIDPELENWVWSDSRHVAEALGWNHTELRTWLVASGRQPEGARKPLNPKETIEQALRQKNIPRSSAVYRQIAERVSFERCADPTFLKLCIVLRRWFPGAEA
jgi:hypothetical protein